MIVVRLMGGVGNQMFQYAFALSHAQRSGQKLKVDRTLLDARGTSDFQSRNFGLANFECELTFAGQDEIAYFNGYPNPSISQRIAYKLRHFFNPELLVVQKGHEFNPEHLRKYFNTCFVGRWQSEDYFRDYKNVIFKSFTIKSEIISPFSGLAEQIDKYGSGAVSIHIRRNDYISNPLFKKEIGFVGEEYYLRAIDSICSVVSHPFFFVFSDDLEWADMFMRERRIRYSVVDNVNIENSAFRDLMGMSRCRHHIISNSTFAWWGAWLSKEPGFVYAPSRWANSVEYSPPRILPDSWIKIRGSE
jgi:hypothetical protein